MENSSNVFADIENRTYWPMARAANLDLHLTGSRRVNMLLTGTDDLIKAALKRLTPDLRGPIQTWTAPAPVQLPAPTHAGTLILPRVEALSAVDQYRLLRWLEQSSPRTQVISTTTVQLLTRVEAGLFDERLYYRLNVACVDLTA